MENQELFESAKKMREFIDDAFNYEVEGYWSGSTHGYHPRGFLRDDILFVDEWHVNNYCYIYIVTERGCGWLKAQSNPRSIGGRPVPQPETGEKIQAWGTGSWSKKGPWCETIDKLITQVRQEIEVKKKEKQEADQEKVDQEKKDRDRKEKDLVDQWS